MAELWNGEGKETCNLLNLKDIGSLDCGENVVEGCAVL